MELCRCSPIDRACGLTGANREIASHWLDQWHDGAPPTFQSFDTAAIAEHVPAIGIFEIRQNESLTCIKAGQFYRMAIGFDLTGQNVLSITNVVDRDARLEWCWQIVEGAVTVSRRAFESTEAGIAMAQGMSLPFSDRADDGARCFFTHNNWRPRGTDWIEGHVRVDLQPPPEREIRIFARSGSESVDYGAATARPSASAGTPSSAY